MTVKITMFDPESGKTTAQSFEHSPVRIGRDPTSEFPLPFTFVSARHAVVEFDDDHTSLVDAGSTNGVLREGRRLPSRQAITITNAITVTIGRLELQVRRLAPGTAAYFDEPHAPGSNDTHGSRDRDNLIMSDVHAAIRQLRPLHENVLRARTVFAAARDALLADIPSDARDLAAAMFSREFPVT